MREQRGETFTARDLLYYGNELYEYKQWEQAILKYEKDKLLKSFISVIDAWVCMKKPMSIMKQQLNMNLI